MRYENSDSVSTTSVVQETREFNAIFIHSKLDDAGLTPAEFRVYAHLARRAGANGAYPSLTSIAKVCKISRHTAVDALSVLWEADMITITHTEGKVNLYFLTPPSKWKLTSANETLVQNKHGCSANEALVLVQNRHTKVIHRRKSIEGLATDRSPSRHVEFIEQWSNAFEKHYGKKYCFQRGKDGSAVKSLLSNGTTPMELVEVARKAWKLAGRYPKDWALSHSDTIARFGSEINGIHARLLNIEKEEARL